MENEKIICKSCGTENETKYEYCKNCGTPLIKQNPQNYTDPFTGYAPKSNQAWQSSNNYSQYQNYNANPYPPPPPPPPTYSQNNVYGNTYVETIDGIPYGEVATFVGKKAHNYMPTFAKMEITNDKTAWHWPTAILSFFIGPIAASLWFFYRKMYKFAAILVVIGTISLLASSLIAGQSFDEVSSFDVVLGLSEESLANNEQLSNTALRFIIANLLTGCISLASTVICGIFTHGWYKKHIHNTILKYRASNIDMGYYYVGLMSKGGTSGGMLALGFVIMICAESIPDIVYKIQTLF